MKRNRIKVLREERGIKQVELAKKISYSISYLSKVEGNKQVPSVNFLEKCADELEVPISQLFEDYIEQTIEPDTVTDINEAHRNASLEEFYENKMKLLKIICFEIDELEAILKLLGYTEKIMEEVEQKKIVKKEREAGTG